MKRLSRAEERPVDGLRSKHGARSLKGREIV